MDIIMKMRCGGTPLLRKKHLTPSLRVVNATFINFKVIDCMDIQISWSNYSSYLITFALISANLFPSSKVCFHSSINHDKYFRNTTDLTSIKYVLCRS